MAAGSVCNLPLCEFLTVVHLAQPFGISVRLLIKSPLSHVSSVDIAMTFRTQYGEVVDTMDTTVGERCLVVAVCDRNVWLADVPTVTPHD